MFLFKVTDALEANRISYALVGGYAMALHGIVRATVDVDLVLNLQLADFEQAERAFESIGLRSRLPVRAAEIFKMRREYIEHRNLIAWSFVDHADPSRVVDVIILHDRAAMSVVKIAVGGRRLSVVSLETLLRLKTAAGRPQDLVDVARIRSKLDGKT